MGGREKAIAKLDEFFATMPRGEGKSSDEGGLASDGNLRRGQIGMYWHGNEPSHHIAYLYSLWGRRDKTAAVVGRICREAYHPTPDGLCGNDDCGQMSAWYLFSMMGFYPVNPCGDGYVLGAPQAPHIMLRLPGGKRFSIIAKNPSIKNMHVKPVTLNGKSLSDRNICHVDVMRGGELVYGIIRAEGEG